MLAATTANTITDLTEHLDEWSQHWWFLAVVFAIAFLDSVIPVVPSETTVIIAGVAVAQFGPRLAGKPKLREVAA